MIAACFKKLRFIRISLKNVLFAYGSSVTATVLGVAYSFSFINNNYMPSIHIK